MAKQVTLDMVRKLALDLAGVEESTAYGAPAFKVAGKIVACVPSNKSAEPGSLMVRIDFDERAELIAAAPDTYYLKDHYQNYAGVLVRLSRIEPEALADLLRGALRFVTRKEGRASRSKSRQPGRRSS